MHPYLQHQLTDARIAEMRSQAERHRMGRHAPRATQRPVGQRIAGPGFALGQVLQALLTTCGQRRQPGTAAVQVPEGLRP